MIKITLLSFALLLSTVVKAGSEDFRLGSLGDSITAGFNAGGLLDRRRNSWSAGSRISSHAAKIRDTLGRSVQARNVAKSGATISDLPRQTELLLKEDFKPDYVTVLIGANDICMGKDLNNLNQRARLILDQTLERIKQASPSVKMVVAAVPNLIHLHEVMSQKSSCLRQWKIFNVCSSVLMAEPDQIERSYASWQSFNQMLTEFASENPDHVKFAPKTGEPNFDQSKVSRIDCFHPSLQGQEFLSDLVWQDGWFAD